MKELAKVFGDLFIAIAKLIGMVLFAVTYPFALINNALKKALFTKAKATQPKKAQA